MSHIVTASCEHPVMKALAIDRHNKAVQLILKELAKDPKLRGATIVADLGELHLQKIGNQNETVQGERILKSISELRASSPRNPDLIKTPLRSELRKSFS